MQLSLTHRVIAHAVTTNRTALEATPMLPSARPNSSTEEPPDVGVLPRKVADVITPAENENMTVREPVFSNTEAAKCSFAEEPLATRHRTRVLEDHAVETQALAPTRTELLQSHNPAPVPYTKTCTCAE